MSAFFRCETSPYHSPSSTKLDSLLGDVCGDQGCLMANAPFGAYLPKSFVLSELLWLIKRVFLARSKSYLPNILIEILHMNSKVLSCFLTCSWKSQGANSLRDLQLFWVFWIWHYVNTNQKKTFKLFFHRCGHSWSCSVIQVYLSSSTWLLLSFLNSLKI